jgi:hypothetical protein
VLGINPQLDVINSNRRLSWVVRNSTSFGTIVIFDELDGYDDSQITTLDTVTNACFA